MRRYLVLRDFVDHEARLAMAFKAGQEIELSDDDAARIHTQEPGALREMDAKTKRDWAPDEDVT